MRIKITPELRKLYAEKFLDLTIYIQGDKLYDHSTSWIFNCNNHFHDSLRYCYYQVLKEIKTN